MDALAVVGDLCPQLCQMGGSPSQVLKAEGILVGFAAKPELLDCLAEIGLDVHVGLGVSPERRVGQAFVVVAHDFFYHGSRPTCESGRCVPPGWLQFRRVSACLERRAPPFAGIRPVRPRTTAAGLRRRDRLRGWRLVPLVSVLAP